ncbi:MAG: hypothetical protein A2583_05715 [Bdellovibrionales bacterium RIFOXYD1_FULL_53_11]|nr:MAG: hypothetical protein A2583_05715 [Bdellovibrionales bacterium RIFOXYD1_FULL_53_11]
MEQKPVIAISAATSFTGAWIAKTLHEKGWKVIAHTAEKQNECTGILAKRIRLLGLLDEPVIFGIRAEDGSMEALIRRVRPGVWINHHHWMAGFRSPGYDRKKALEIGVDPLTGLVKALSDSDCKGIIQTGSYFEPGEAGRGAEAHITPYAQSKCDVWRALHAEAAGRGLALSKCVIPDPVGPLENEDRLIPLMIKKARSGDELVMNAPNICADRLPVEYLARVYDWLARGLLDGNSSIARPSGRVSTNLAWVQFVNEELITKRLGLAACPVRVNADPALEKLGDHRNNKEEAAKIDWDASWDFYARHING